MGKSVAINASEIRAAITELCNNFPNSRTSLVSYIDYFVYTNTPECIEEREKTDSTMGNHEEHFETMSLKVTSARKKLCQKHGGDTLFVGRHKSTRAR